jgi:lipoate-protein ligase A
VLRFWESAEYCVVAGPSGAPATSLPVARRCSGGGAVVLGPGCLVYSAVVPYALDARLVSVRESMRMLLGGVATALGLELRGESDLALADRKVSGNSQRRGRNALLLHGTVLYGFDLDVMSQHLPEPARQPAWRRGRRHGDFVENLGIGRADVAGRIGGWWAELVGGSGQPPTMQSLHAVEELHG